LRLAVTPTQAAAPQTEPISFNRDVRPILSENCFACHGFDPKHREAGLRLDTFEGATADRNGSIGIVPKDPAKSAVWERIRSTDPDVVMPPPKSHRNALTPKQQEILRQWIEQEHSTNLTGLSSPQTRSFADSSQTARQQRCD
jgi:mono/diheme cytochrome c family protein